MQTGETGYTLAAVLLLGKDEVITSVLPHFKTDAIVRIRNTDRYNDRDDIRVNLIESYDRLMEFIAKHLPEKFHLEGDKRINLRDRNSLKAMCLKPSSRFEPDKLVGKLMWK